MDEQQLINRLKSKDENCFMEVVNNFKKKVVALCYSYTQDYHEAEDLSQEIFISLFRNIDRFRGDCSLSTYIYKITVSKCIDYTRKRSLKNFLSGLFNFRQDEKIDLDEKNYVRDCILALPEELKVPIILFYYTGLNHNEIANILDISQKAVEGRIYRAKQKLRVEFEKEGYQLCKKSETI